MSLLDVGSDVSQGVAFVQRSKSIPLSAKINFLERKGFSAADINDVLKLAGDVSVGESMGNKTSWLELCGAVLPWVAALSVGVATFLLTGEDEILDQEVEVGGRTQLDPDSQMVDVDDMAFEGVEDESVKGLSGVIESLKEQSDSLQKSVAAISARLNSDETPEWAKQVLLVTSAMAEDINDIKERMIKCESKLLTVKLDHSPSFEDSADYRHGVLLAALESLFHAVVPQGAADSIMLQLEDATKPHKRLNDVCNTLLMYVKNLVEHPSVPRYHRISMTNQSFKTTFHGLEEPFGKVLNAIGFEKQQKENCYSWSWAEPLTSAQSSPRGDVGGRSEKEGGGSGSKVDEASSSIAKPAPPKVSAFGSKTSKLSPGVPKTNESDSPAAPAEPSVLPLARPAPPHHIVQSVLAECIRVLEEIRSAGPTFKFVSLPAAVAMLTETPHCCCCISRAAAAALPALKPTLTGEADANEVVTAVLSSPSKPSRGGHLELCESPSSSSHREDQLERLSPNSFQPSDMSIKISTLQEGVSGAVLSPRISSSSSSSPPPNAAKSEVDAETTASTAAPITGASKGVLGFAQIRAQVAKAQSQLAPAAAAAAEERGQAAAAAADVKQDATAREAKEEAPPEPTAASDPS